MTAALILCSAPAGVAAERPDFSGTWHLDREVSEDPAAKVQAMLGLRRSILSSGRGYGNPSGPGGTGRSGLPGGAPPPTEVLQERIQAIFQGDEKLEIQQDLEGLHILQADGRRRIIRTAGKRRKRKEEKSGLISRGRWKKDGRLVVTTVLKENRELLEVFRRGPGRRQLTITTTLSGDQWTPELTFRRIYQRGGDPREGVSVPPAREPSKDEPAEQRILPVLRSLRR
ncbi:MAG: hypothetical protein ACE5ID_04790 [Acidobacteriota bacterium]